MKKWFTDLDESVRVKLMEDYADQHDCGMDIAFNALEETAWSEDGLSIANDLEIRYLQICDDSNIIIDRIKKEMFPDIQMKFEIRQLLIKIDQLESSIKIWKS